MNAVSNKMKISFKGVLLLLASAFILGGCASPATHEAMVPASIQTVKKHPQTVNVAVAGGQETDAMGKSQISNSTLQKALTEAIEKSKTFSQVVPGTGGNYLLTVNIFNIDQPNFGLNLTTKLEAGWTLKRADTGTVVWQESIRSEHTSTVSDAFVAVERLRLATEGAARNNIAQGLAKISNLSL